MKAWLWLAGMVSVLLLAGCENTVQGFGKDMQNMGEKIQKSDTTSSQQPNKS